MSTMNRIFTADRKTEPIKDTDLPIWSLVSAMAIDLAGAIRRGDFHVESLGAMMRACHGCPFARICTLFVERREGRTQHAPSYCPSRPHLTRLRDHAPRARRGRG